MSEADEYALWRNRRPLSRGEVVFWTCATAWCLTPWALLLLWIVCDWVEKCR